MSRLLPIGGGCFGGTTLVGNRVLHVMFNSWDGCLWVQYGRPGEAGHCLLMVAP